MSDKIRRYCCCQFQEFHLACHSQVWNVYNECAVCTVCAYNTVCAIILCTVIRFTVCKHIIVYFARLLYGLFKNVWGKNCRKWRWTQKLQPICTIISLLPPHIIRLFNDFSIHVFHITLLVCRSHIYVI